MVVIDFKLAAVYLWIMVSNWLVSHHYRPQCCDLFIESASFLLVTDEPLRLSHALGWECDCWSSSPVKNR